VVAIGDAIAADEPASMSELAQTKAAAFDTEGEDLAALGGSCRACGPQNPGMQQAVQQVQQEMGWCIEPVRGLSQGSTDYRKRKQDDPTVESAKVGKTSTN
jgi:hypothetical protein